MQELINFIKKYLNYITVAIITFSALLGAVVMGLNRIELTVVVFVILLLIIMGLGVIYFYRVRRWYIKRSIRRAILWGYIAILVATLTIAFWVKPVNCYIQVAVYIDPLCVIPEASKGEILVIVTRFETSQDIVSSRIIAEQLRGELKTRESSNLNARVEFIAEIVENDRRAEKILNETKASLVIWGIAQADGGIITNYTIATTQVSDPVERTEFYPIAELGGDVKMRFAKGIDQRYVTTFTVGQILYFREEFLDAMPLFEEAIQLMENEPKEKKQEIDLAAAWHYLGFIYDVALTDNEHLIKAASAYTESINLDPEWRNACRTYFDRGRIYYLLEIPNEALADYDQAIQLNSADCAVAFTGKGLIYSSQGDFNSAVEEYNQAIEHTADSEQIPLIHYHRAYAYYSQNNYTAALDDFNQAISLNSEYTNAYIGRGTLYIHQGNYTRAQEDLNQAITLDSLNADAYFNRGVAYLYDGDFNNALEDFNKSIDIDPSSPDSYLNRGYIYLTRNDPRAAEDYLQWVNLNAKQTLETELSNTPFTTVIDMSNGFVYRLKFEAQEGQVISASAKSVVSNKVDPILILLDGQGNPLIMIDDSSQNYDAILDEYTVDEDSIYTLVVSHGGGGYEGQAEVQLDIK